MGTMKPKQKKSRPGRATKNPAPPTSVGIGQNEKTETPQKGDQSENKNPETGQNPEKESTMENAQTQTQTSFRQSTIQKWSKLATALSKVEWDVAGPILKSQIKGFETLFPNASSCNEVLETLRTFTVSAGNKGTRNVTLFGVVNPTMAQLIAEQANWASVDADQLRRALNASFGQVLNQFVEITGAPKRKVRQKKTA